MTNVILLLGIAAFALAACLIGLASLILCSVVDEMRNLNIRTGKALSYLLRRAPSPPKEEEQSPWAEELPAPIRLDPEGLELRRAAMALKESEAAELQAMGY